MVNDSHIVDKHNKAHKNILVSICHVCLGMNVRKNNITCKIHTECYCNLSNRYVQQDQDEYEEIVLTKIVINEWQFLQKIYLSIA